MPDIYYKELSYKIVGILFKVSNELGGDYHEKYYQRAIEVLLKKENLHFKREFPVNIEIESSKIGHHFLDFLIDDKVILETKKGDRVIMSHIKQVLMYLKTMNLQLGLLAYFGHNGVQIKRIVNKRYIENVPIRTNSK
jgi:GxxExxY protein